MGPIDDPAQLTHPRLREFAYQAAGIATVAEAANDVERWSWRHCRRNRSRQPGRFGLGCRHRNPRSSQGR
jgi:hypothetical protein